ncbi:lipopolysaccharide kinase InaA family protein [Legionella parisiensis]|uniref:lipopolysaccharide kinase InaA family protein n=1 Tax=Legionella parisiensis TaxID=45071 RepID=UPI00072FB293|nr:lipopolysaccharide kinase InaA family protein [Legionella parisiensis]KTD41529.1 protein kinase [Legionella parisiensis]STX76153.1 protein kinase [Legionella parisiensis]
MTKYKYEFSNKLKKSNSTFELNGVIYTPLRGNPGGYTSINRFFGIENKPTFIVKKPRYKSRDSEEIINFYATAYEKEKIIWNTVYPEKKAELFRDEDGRIRLVLPFLKASPVSYSLSNYHEDPLIYCRQILAIVDELSRFHNLGLRHGDLKLDNILIEKKEDGTFRAYLVDFGNVYKISNSDHEDPDWIPRDCNALVLDSLTSCITGLRTRHSLFYSYTSLDLIKKELLEEIENLCEENKSWCSRASL